MNPFANTVPISFQFEVCDGSRFDTYFRLWIGTRHRQRQRPDAPWRDTVRYLNKSLKLSGR